MISTETAPRYAIGDRVDVLPFADGCPVCRTKAASTLGTVVEYYAGDRFIVAMDFAKGAVWMPDSHVCGARVICSADMLRPVDWCGHPDHGPTGLDLPYGSDFDVCGHGGTVCSGPVPAALYPHYHEDIEAFTACQECIDRAAELRIASGD